MWWRLGLLAAATIGLLVLLFWPISPIDIVVEMPPVRGGRRGSAEQLETVLNAISAWAGVAVVALILGGALWIGRGIVRKHGRPR